MNGSVEAVFFDVDGTLLEGTGVCPPSFERMLIEQVAAARGVDEAQAERFVTARADCGDPYGQLGEFGLDTTECLSRMAERLRPSFKPLQDAVNAARQLRERGYKLYPATTNGRTACIAKLTVIGLAQPDGTSIFESLFGGADVVPEGKTSAAFYTTLLARIGLTREQVVMVGDDPHADLTLAQEAGIARIAVRTSEAETGALDRPGVARLRDLTRLLDWLPARTDAPAPAR